MGYKKAHDALPHHLLCAIQEYIDGETIYIPKKESSKLPWGAKTQTRKTIRARNSEIIARYRNGSSVTELARQYFRSTKTIYKIISAAKNG